MTLETISIAELISFFVKFSPLGLGRQIAAEWKAMGLFSDMGTEEMSQKHHIRENG